MRPFYQLKTRKIRRVRSAKLYKCIDGNCSPVSDYDIERLKEQDDLERYAANNAMSESKRKILEAQYEEAQYQKNMFEIERAARLGIGPFDPRRSIMFNPMESQQHITKPTPSLTLSKVVTSRHAEQSSIMLLPNDPRPTVLTFLIKRLSIVDLESAVKRIIFSGFRQYLSYPEDHINSTEVLRFVPELEKPLWIDEDIVKPNISM